MRRLTGTNLRSLLPGGRTLRSVGVLVAGTAGGQAIVLLASPLLTRLYTPAEFGYLGVFVALVALMVVIGSLRYEVAVSVATTDAEARNVLALCLAIVAVVAAAVALAVALLADPLLALLRAEALAPYLWLLPVSIAGGASYQALSYWAIRTERFRPIAASTVARGAIQVAAQLALALLHPGAGGLLGGDAMGRVAATGPLARLAVRGAHGEQRVVTLRGMASAAARFRRYPAFSAPAALLSTASLQIPALLFVALYDARIAGLIALAQRVIGVPVTLLGKSVSQVYVGQAARVAREDPARMRIVLMGTALRLLVIATLPAAALMITGPTLFALAFGESWRTAGQFVRLLAPMFVVQFAVFPVSETLNLLERQRLRLIWDVARLTLVIAAFWSARTLDWSASNAVLAYAVVMFVSYALLFFLSWHAAGRVRR